MQAGESGPVVLLVEDDQDGRRMYADWLKNAGFRVDEAHNGLQALERALDSRPQIVVTDLNIPGIDGFELTRRLRQDSRTRDVPVIAVTGYAAFASDPKFYKTLLGVFRQLTPLTRFLNTPLLEG